MEQPTYTLDEALAILNRQACDRDGHMLSEQIVRNMAGSVTLHVISCDRCRARFTETTPTAEVDAMLAQLETDRGTAYWADDRAAQLDAVESWLLSLRDHRSGT